MYINCRSALSRLYGDGRFRKTIFVAIILTATTSGCGSARPSELIQAGDSKTNCIYASIGAVLKQAEQTTGVTYNCLEAFNASDPTWAGWVTPWLIEKAYGYRAWLAADPTGRQIILTQNLIPNSEAGNPNWVSECAAGDYDRYAAELASNLVKAGFGYSVIRLGAEMNGTWNVGSLGATMASWRQWGQCFAQEVKAMRAVAAGHLLFDWNINANYRDIPLADFYPGDAYVDIIGIDAYDDSGIALPRVGNPTRWSALVDEPEGLNAVEAFAVAHGKPLSIPEWATVTTQGDDANYVSKMADFIDKNDVAFQSWFDAGDDHIFQLSRTQAPLSLAAYIKAFG
jgi:Glycosyl hydrolase family 26